MLIISNKLNLTNKIFGRWKVIKPNGVNKCGQILWLCECQCENQTLKNVVGSSLVNGKSTSCGCFAKENTKKVNKKYNTYNLNGKHGIGYTNKDEEFYFDLEDYNKIKDYCWRINDSGYVVTTINRKTVRFHRLVMNAPNEYQVDHIFHNRKDNRKDFLRLATNQQNSMNKLTNLNANHRLGVYYDKSKNKWTARLVLNGKQVFFKRFNTYEESISARIQAEKKYFKEFAPTDNI